MTASPAPIPDLGFLPRFKYPLLEGGKTCTTRRTPHFRPGAKFRAFGHLFVIEALIQVPFWQAVFRYYAREGTTSPPDFLLMWEDAYPMDPLDGERPVWVHFFHLIGPEVGASEHVESLPLKG